jgi:hypothetical protein
MMSGFIEVLQKMSRGNNRAARKWFHNRGGHSRRDWVASDAGVRPAPMQTIATLLIWEAKLDRCGPKLF